MQKRILFLIATVMMFISSAMAQVTTSGISGKVTMNDVNGEGIIGATVLAVHVPSGTRYSATTNVKGAFAIKGMRTGGPYTINVSYIGMQSKFFQNITLSLGETYHINVWLKDDEKTLGEVVVKGQLGLNKTRTGAAQSINNARLQELPSISHSVADIARINPFVKVTEGGAMTIAGSNNRYNAIQIDGAMSNDVFGLTSNGANGGMAGTQPFSMETVDQLQVSIAPFDVRQSGFTGGSVNAITKSGTNEFHGSFYSYYQNDGMVSDKYKMHNGNMSNPYGSMTNYTIGATLGGPIVKNKLFAFLNFERSNNEYDNAYSTPGSQSKVDFGVAQQIYDYIKAQAPHYTGKLGTPKEYSYSDKVGIKLDWNINDRNHASLRWSFVDAKQNNNTSSASQLVTSDYAYDFVSKTNSLVFELNSRLGKNMSNKFHATWTSVRDKRNPGNPFPMIQVSNVGGGTLCIGNERSSMANGLDQDIYALTDNLTWTLQDHEVTVGTHNELYKFGNLFCQDLYGTYMYQNPDDFFAGKINRFRYGQGVESVTGTKRWNATFGAGQLGFYIQDRWEVLQNLYLSLGLRADIPFMLDTPTANLDKFGANGEIEIEGFNNWVTRNESSFPHLKGLRTDQRIAMKPMWSPRFGFRWNTFSDNSLIIRGGIGVFTGRVPYVWISNNISNTGIQQMSYSTFNTTGITPQYNANNAIYADPTLNPTAPAQAAQTINVFNKNFKYPQQLRADLAVDFTDPFVGINWTLEGIYSKTINDMIVKNLDITATGETFKTQYGLPSTIKKIINGQEVDVDVFRNVNRPMYDYSTIPYSGIYVLDNVSKGYSYNISLKAEKRFDFGLDAMASYTYGKSKTINNGSSSVAASCWTYNYTHGNPNDPELANSNFNVPHQVVVSLYQHLKWNKDIKDTYDNITTIGLIYAGNSGSPFNVYVNGDVNGDNGYNDLMYIPTDDEIDALLDAKMFNATAAYDAETQASNLKEWLANEYYLKDHRGEYFERNAANEKWENRLDLHIDHKFGFKWGSDIKYFQVGLDIINFTNLLNKNWGATLSQSGYNYYSPLSFSKGKYQFLHDANYDMRSYSDYYSRWRMQLTAKFIF
jgi:hypothetical protein